MIVKRFFFNFSNNIVKKISGKKNLDTDTSCPRCNYPKETINHIFECLFALHRVELYQTIHLSGFFPNKSVYQNIDIYSVLEKKDVVYSKLLIDTFSQILWYIQKERNGKAFNGNMFNLQTPSIQPRSRRNAEKTNLSKDKEENDTPPVSAAILTLLVEL